MTRNDAIREALALDPMDRLNYRSGPLGRGWYLQRFGKSEKFLGSSSKNIIEDAKADAEMSAEDRLAAEVQASLDDMNSWY